MTADAQKFDRAHAVTSGGGGVRDGQNVTAVHDLLRRGIVTGQVPAGEISQVALARQLEVGRTPLREAIRMLQREGLVISEPNRRLRIVELSAPDAEELSVMRIALEGVAIRITVPVLGSGGIAELEGLTAQMDHYLRRQDHAGYALVHCAFHACLVAAAGERLTKMCAQLFDHAERYRVSFGTASLAVWNQRQSEHREIVDAATAGDSELAVLRMVEHYVRSAANVFVGLGGDYRPDRLRIACATVAPGSETSLAG
ncbi:GntR family transcriptional regulator [Acidothermaceae bacterium B102]|nr:GntR family transcriptional regulator [Acidothermaceae bacterium B102]